MSKQGNLWLRSDIRISRDSKFETSVVRSSHFNRTPNKISRIIQLKPVKYNYSFGSISQDCTIRQWFTDNGVKNMTVNLRATSILKDQNESKQLQTEPDRIPTAFDCSDEYFAATGYHDGSLHVMVFH